MAQENLVVKIYGCPAGQAAATAEQLRSDFGVFAGVRIAADERTSQVIVQAPAEIQAHISQRMAAAAPPVPANGPSASDGSRTPAAPVQTRRIALRHVRADQLGASLWSVLGNRLSALPNSTPQLTRYNLALFGGGHVDVTLDATAGQALVEGIGPAVDACARLIEALDAQNADGGKDIHMLPLRRAASPSVQRAVQAVRSSGPPSANMPMVAMLQNREGQKPAAAKPEPAGQEGKARAGLLNPVQIEMLDGLDVLVLRGSQQDVNQVMDIINQIERLSAEIEPAVELAMLKHANCEALAALLRSLYDEVYLTRQGEVSITPLVKPNAILVVGRPENAKTVMTLIGRLDQPVAPNTLFQVFRLHYATAGTAQYTIQQFFASRIGQTPVTGRAPAAAQAPVATLAPVVTVTADARSNALIVEASPSDMAEVVELIRRLDTSTSASVNEVRIVQLQHSLAQDLAQILQTAIAAATSQQAGGLPGPMPGMGGMPRTPTRPPTAGVPGGMAGMQSQQRSSMLRFLTIDARGKRLIESGILDNVQVTPDLRANALVVSAPPQCMELLEALIQRLDELPAAEAQVKVFTVFNGDAQNLYMTLTQLFSGQAAPTGGPGAAAAMPAIQTSTSGNVASLIPLRFSVDVRTNSIIATGVAADLAVVEAVLTRLDENVRNRKTEVFKLKNSYATQVAATITTFLQSQRTLEQGMPVASAFETIDREVVVVAEQVSNSLVLSATQRFFDEIKSIIDQLDARPPMVMIQVLLASVQLSDTNEFGVELGLQDSVLFDRSLLSNPLYQNTTTTAPNGVQTTTQTLIAANNTPGFNFNDTLDPLGNSAATSALAGASQAAGQALTSFSLGRQNSTLGYGGLVLSLSSDSVSALIRALAQNQRFEVLERPQIMTMDNQPAFVQIGQSVPRITNSTITTVGTTNTTILDQVGVVLKVQPRVCPDGMIVLLIDAVKSALEPIDQGIPINTTSTGQVIRSPIYDTTEAYTTVSAMNGQTIVLGGLIDKEKTEIHAKVPLLGDIPLLGRLFRHDLSTDMRNELLIVMTPHIVRTEADADAVRREEAARMSWCLCDVTAVAGEIGVRKRSDQWGDSEVKAIYPDSAPRPIPPAPAVHGGPAEQIPAPPGAPARPPAAPLPANPPLSGASTAAPPRPGSIAPLPQAPRPPAPNSNPPPNQPGVQLQYGQPVQPAQYWGYAPPNPAGTGQAAVYQQPMPGPGTAPLEQAYPSVAQPAVYQPPVSRP